MSDDALSAAVIAYVWGVPRKSWPSCRPESLSAEQRALLPRVEAAVRAADDVAPTWTTLPEGHALAAAAVRREHPELSDEAVAAIANAYCYAWK